MYKIRRLSACQKGQTMLIVVLAIVVALTVGLSVASRSITNLKTTTEEINSQKALAAAEAGIERTLQELTTTSSSVSGSFENNSSFSTTVVPLFGTEILLAGGNTIEKDDGMDLWFSEHNSNGTPNYSTKWPSDGSTGQLTIYWGQTINECNEAALEIVVISGSKASPVQTKYPIDPCSARVGQNSFYEPDDKSRVTISERDFYYNHTISITNGLVARIVPLYASTQIAVSVVSGGDLPSQGAIISSIGTSRVATGDITERKITVFQGYPSLPVEYFPNNFFYYSL